MRCVGRRGREKHFAESRLLAHPTAWEGEAARKEMILVSTWSAPQARQLLSLEEMDQP